MSLQLMLRRVLLAFTTLFLALLAWQALSGALRQLPRANTTGQKIETAVQFQSGLLSLLVVMTRFWRHAWAIPVQRAWGVSLAAAAGLSALVWGPPMPLIGALFAAAALIVVRVVTWVLRTDRAP